MNTQASIFQNTRHDIPWLTSAFEARSTAHFLPHIEQHFQALLSDAGDWNPSIYDLAWVLSCDFFPPEDVQEHLNTLLALQNPDGTWGDATYVPHAAVADTLAVVMALIRLKQPIPAFNQLKTSLNRLFRKCSRYPYHDTVAFEIIVPQLLHWIENHGISFELSPLAQHFVHQVGQHGRKKLQMLRDGPGLFNPAISLSYTAEFAALMPLTDEEIQQLFALILPNGAVGLSPAATAGVIIILRTHQRPVPLELYCYLEEAFHDYQAVGFPNLHPIVTSRRLWNVLPWLVSGNIFDLLQHPPLLKLLTRIYQEIMFDKEGRVSWDTHNITLPDLDDTAVALALYSVLTGAGVQDLQPATSASLKHFQRKDGTFFCYPYELHPSPAAILHTLMAMDFASRAFGRAFSDNPDNQSIIRRLLQQLDPRELTLDQLGHDKWHATWTYGLQRWLSLPAIHAAYPETVQFLVEEVLDRQQSNGGWGQQSATAEETSYVISGLVSALKNTRLLSYQGVRHEIQDALVRAREFLRGEIDHGINMPPIWISKNLYAPKYQIISAVLDARYSLETIQPLLEGDMYPHLADARRN